MKKIIAILSVTVVILGFMASCALLPSTIGNEVLVVNKHFLTDQIFYNGEWVSSYLPDGSFEYTQRSWDYDNDEWEQIGGARGTYEYDNSTKILTRTYTERYNFQGEEGWVALADYYADHPDVTSWSMVDTLPQLFTANGSYTIYVLNTDGEWEYTYNNTWTETTAAGESSQIFNQSSKYIITATEFSFFQENSQKSFDDSAAIANYQREWGGDTLRLAPEGSEWKMGETVTFYYTETVNRNRNWDYSNEVWNDWNDWTYTDIRNVTCTHMGDYMILATAQTMK